MTEQLTNARDKYFTKAEEIRNEWRAAFEAQTLAPDMGMGFTITTPTRAPQAVISSIENRDKELADVVQLCLKGLNDDDTDTSRSNQAVIFSGVSHSGKTANHWCCLLDLLNHAPFQNAEAAQKLAHTFMAVVFPLLDLFLGAPTTDNLESSCCTTVVSLAFEQKETEMIAKTCKLSIFYPELNRVVSLKDENSGGTFNIFYAVARNNSTEFSNFKILGPVDPFTSQGEEEHQPTKVTPSFKTALDALGALGIKQEQVEEIFVILNAILLLGNIEFVSIPNGTFASDETRPILSAVCNLLGIKNEKAFEECLCKNTIMELRTDVAIVEAQTKRDSLTKALYQCVLNFLIRQINAKLSGGYLDSHEDDHNNTLKHIYLVDMVALPLEVENVGLRHVLVTHSYEKLQWIYCKDIMQAFHRANDSSQSNGTNESLPLIFQYNVDENSTITDLIESRDAKTPGLFSLLSDKAVCDSLLYNRLHRFHNERKDISFSSKKETFSVRYPFLKMNAMYLITGFQRYNTSALSDETIDLLRSACACQIIVQGAKQQFLTSKERTAAKNTRLPSTCASYTDDCAELFRMISGSTRHYVRCFRLINHRAVLNCAANEMAVATTRQFDRQGVFEQVKMHGLPYSETFNFSTTLKFEDVVEMAQKYDSALLSSVEYCQASTFREKVQVILNSFWLDSDFLLESKCVHFTFKNQQQLQRAIRRRRRVNTALSESTESAPSLLTENANEEEDDESPVDPNSVLQCEPQSGSADTTAKQDPPQQSEGTEATTESDTVKALDADLIEAPPAEDTPDEVPEKTVDEPAHVAAPVDNNVAHLAPTNMRHTSEQEKQMQIQFREILARAGASMTIAAVSGDFFLTKEFASKLLQIQNRCSLSSTSIEDVNNAICELETLCRYIPENYDGLNGPKSLRIPVEKIEFEDNQIGGSFTESSRLYSLTDALMEGSYASRVSEGEAKEFLVLARGQLYHYFRTPPHYKRKYLVMRVLRALDMLIVRNLERTNFVLELINFSRLQGIFDLLIELLSSHDTHTTMVFLITRVLANVVSSFDNTHVWFSTGHGLKGFLANITWTFEEMRVRDSPNDFYIIFFVLKTMYHLTRTGSLQKALSDSKVYHQEKLPQLLMSIIRTFSESAMRCLAVRLAANIACIYQQEFQQLGIARQFVKLMIDSIDPQLMKYVITALVAMVNEGATVEEQLEAACNAIVLYLLDVFDIDSKCFKRIIKSLAQLTQASSGCKDMIKEIFGDNLTQALDDFSLFYKHDNAKCDAIVFKFLQYKDSLLDDPDCDHNRMTTVAKCKDNLTRFGLHWKMPQPPVDRGSWSPAVNFSRNSFDQSPVRSRDWPSASPSVRSPESNGYMFPRLSSNENSRRRLNFMEEEQNGIANSPRTELPPQHTTHPSPRTPPLTLQVPSADTRSPARIMPPPLPSKTSPLRMAPLKPASAQKASATGTVPTKIDDMV